MRPKGSRALLVLLSTSLGIVVGIGLAELLVWLLHPSPGRGVHFAVRSKRCCDYDPALIWTLRPFLDVTWRHADYEEHTRTNSLGLRGDELASQRGDLRILAAGDSFTYGVGVDNDETYPAVLQSLLRRPDLAVEVLNAGVPGYSFDQTYRALIDRRLDLEPDLVVAGVHCTDLATDSTQSLYALSEGRLVPLEAGRTWVGLQFRLRDAAPRWLRPLGSFRALLDTLERRDPFGLLPDRPPEALASWQREKIRLQLRELSRMGRRQGFEVVAVLMPCKEDVDEPGHGAYADLGRKLEAVGIPTLLAVSALRERGGALAPLFFREDIHLRPRGNRLLAEAIADFLKGRGIVPAPQEGRRRPPPADPGRGASDRASVKGPGARAILIA